MESILRGAAVYLFVWLIFRLSGKRSLAEVTTFDAALVLIISETTQNALLEENNSITNMVLLIATILGIDVLLSYVKHKSSLVDRIINGAPIVLLDPSGIQQEVMDRERVNREEILEAGRSLEGLANLDEVEYAVLETTGSITIVPKRSA